MNKTFSRIFLAISLFSFGFIAALVMLTDLNMTEKGEAAKPSTPIATVSKDNAALQPTVQGTLQDFNNAFVQIAKKVTPSVVTIKTKQVIEHPDLPPGFDDFFNRFFPRQQDLTQQVLGSGVIVRKDGYILTNNHVVARGKEITVTLYDGREFKAKNVSTDPRSDLAVVQIDQSDLPAIEIGDSDELQVGEWVIAIGSPFGEQLQHTVTAGIVSAKGRTDIGLRESNIMIQDFIQTDAAINPGNSGGALVNIYGQLVGINSAIATQSGGYQGIGFSIPANMAVKVMNDLINKGEVTRAYLGVSIQDVDNDIAKAMRMDRPYGAQITEIRKGSPAADSDLKEGDVITEVDGRTVQNPGDLQAKISVLEPGTEHQLTVVRNGNQRAVSVTVGEMPSQYGMASSENQEQQKSSQGSLGMTLDDITPQMAQQYNLPITSGVLVTAVDPGSPAADKGIQRGDIITHVGVDNPVKSVDDYQSAMEQYQPGDSVILRVRRGDRSFFVGISIPEK